jgi:pyruvate,orthophosphate dikinase
MRYVYGFAEGSKDDRDLLGGKGANLAEMTALGLPVPPGFTITTDACRASRSRGSAPDGLGSEVREHLTKLETVMHRRLGDPSAPLLLSVRSGARFSMPGMMETVLNIGLNDQTVAALVSETGDARFAWDSYRRLLQMFGRTVMDVPASRFDTALEKAKADAGAVRDIDLTAEQLRDLVDEYQGVIVEATSRTFPQDPYDQLDEAVLAVFRSWDGQRARLYRRQEAIPDDLGTAVNVMDMVFGNRGEDSGTGVAFTRDPSTGAPEPYGDYLPNAQGEDVVAGIRNTLTLDDLAQRHPKQHAELLDIMRTLESHFRDLCDIEFTIEQGKLWMLQTRVGKRTPEAAFTIAVTLVDEDMISMDEALTRVSGAQLGRLMFPQIDAEHAGDPWTHGVAASPGAAVGRAVFDSKRAAVRAAAGDKVVLVRRETNPDDLGGMIAAQGILTSRGGKTSHAAVVARGMGKPCVVGAEELTVDEAARIAMGPGGATLKEGDMVSLDGIAGAVFRGEVPVVASPVVEALDSASDARHDDNPIVAAVARLMKHADDVRRLGVRANADTGEDAARARRMGAVGIGLARTEHMFLGDRKQLVSRLVLAKSDAERALVYEELLPLQRRDFTELLAAMDELPVIVRLLDPPLHEFLPDITELSVQVALEDIRGNRDSDHHHLLQAVQQMHEANPMMGMRGVRLGLVLPGLYGLQVRAMAEATADRLEAGGTPMPEIMVPLVAARAELALVRNEAERVIAAVAEEREVDLDIPIGTMIELPRAALCAEDLAHVAEFFSFGSNDLTQTTWGFSRDDVEGAFFTDYLDAGIFQTSPFETIDVDGVGAFIRMAAAAAREVRPSMELGVCGEHGGDPASVHLFHDWGLDYVSCSPFRVPIARLEAGRAAIGSDASDTR